MIVTFMYKINNSSTFDNNNKYYGKYIGYMSDDYEEGLDKELTHKLYDLIKKHYSINNIDDIVIGVIGFNRDTYDYFSENEANIFDILYCDWSNQEKEIYVNGKLVKDNIINQ